jgi:chromosomal replication initiator protein
MNNITKLPNAWVIPGIKKKKMDALNYIIEIVCHKYGFTEEQLKGKTRKREIVYARQMVMALVQNYFKGKTKKYTLNYVGNKLGGKDHATVLYGRRNINNLREVDKQIREDYNDLSSQVRINLNNFI